MESTLPLSIVFYYLKPNRTAFNVLIATLDQDPFFNKTVFFYPDHVDHLITRLKDGLLNSGRVVLAVSFSTVQLWDIQKMMKRVRKRFGTSLFYVAGGPHPTGDPEGVLKMGFDVAVLGEGERIFPELIKAWDRKETFSEIPSIAFLDRQKVIKTKRAPPLVLDEHPPFSLRTKTVNPIEITRGCPFGCFFCQTSPLNGSVMRHRSLDDVARHAKVLGEHGLRYIRYITPNAFAYGALDSRQVQPEIVKELLVRSKEGIGPSGKVFFGSFPSEVRPESVTPELLGFVKKYCNNKNIVVGAQTGSPRLLRECHRGHTMEDLVDSVRYISEFGLVPNIDLIFGLPGETEEDLHMTGQLIKKLVGLGGRIHAHTFLPLPGTVFQNKPAGRLNASGRKIINSYVHSKALFGQWNGQEKQARKIARYLAYQRGFPSKNSPVDPTVMIQE